MKGRKLLPVIIVVLVFILIFFLIKKQKENLPYVNPGPRTIISSISLEGIVAPGKEIKFFALVIGKLISIQEPGVYIEKGNFLFQIDDKSLKHKANSLSIQIDSLKKDIKYWTLELKKLKNLFNAGAIPESEYKTAELRLRNLTEKSNVLSEEMKSLNYTLENFKVTAQFNGTVISTNFKASETLILGREILRFRDLKEKKIIAKISSSERSLIKEGMSAEIELENLSIEGVPGKIVKIKNISSDSKHSLNLKTDSSPEFEIEISFDNSKASLQEGVKVSVEVIRNKINSEIAIPLQSIVISEDKGSFVFIVRDKFIILQKVETGVSDDEFIEVKSGINKDDIIILNPNQFDFSVNETSIPLKNFRLQKNDNQ